MKKDMIEMINGYKGTYADKVRAHMHFIKSELSDKKAEFEKESNGDSLRHYDYTSYCTRKREEGTTAGIAEARKRLSGVMSQKDLDAWFAFSNSMIMKGGYNEAVDWFNAIAISAAIWILDELTLFGKIDEIYPYLPAVDDIPEGDTVIGPLKHPMYDNTLISSLVYLIRHRNSSRKGSEPQCGSLVWEKGKPDDDEKSRELRAAFDAVISLIKKESINAVVKKYEEKVWEFYRISFSVMAAVAKKEESINAEIEELQAPVSNVINFKKAPNVLLRQPAAPIPFPDDMSSGLRDIDQRKIQKLQFELDMLDQVTVTEISLPNDRERLVRSLKGVVSDSLAEELISFHIEDPFEASFALLYLMDQNSLIPWLYYGSVSVAYTLCDQLPYDTLPDMPAKPVRITEWNDALYQHRYKGYRFSDVTDASEKPVEREYAKNLSQLIFSNTQSLVPRVVPEQINMTGFLEGVGELTEQEKEAYSLLSYVLLSGQIRTDSAAQYQALQTIKRELDENQDCATGEEETTEKQIDEAQLISEIKRLRERNKRLVERLSTALADHKKDNKQIQLLRHSLELQDKELSDLREAVYILENSGEQETVIDHSIQYPYVTKEKIVSFGGHQAWLKEIRRKLPGVTFVGPETLPNIELIRNAEAVWLQTNCLSHAAFFRIINIVRQSGIPLRYFSWSGADKCAEQIVRSLEL